LLFLAYLTIALDWVKANKKKPSDLFKAVLKVLLNTQNNDFNSPKKIAVLGYVDIQEAKVNPSAHKKNSVDLEKSSLLQDLNSYVTQLAHDIVKANKIPVVIGGGHQSAYSLTKGSALALNKKINAINLCAYTKTKATGDGANNNLIRTLTEGFLNRYFIFGIHENYANQLVLNQIKRLKKRIKYNTFESIFVRQELKFKAEIKKAKAFVSDDIYGVEIDCDAIESLTKKSKTFCGLSLNKSRIFVAKVTHHHNIGYIHFGKTTYPSSKNEVTKTAKLMSCFITDFLRSSVN
jgi:formiminoglutamase